MRETEEIRKDKARPAERLRIHQAKVGKAGALALPPRLLKALGASARDRLEVVERDGGLEIRPSLHTLARVYIEPTSRCNLTCRTCIRNTWSERTGDMSPATFAALAASLGRFKRLESVMFGGFGEPTAHPDILAMVRRVKALGVRVELTTNGTTLDGALVSGLFEARLDRLWVSFDGAEEASFANVRRGADFDKVVAGLKRLQERNARGRHAVKLGIAFVALRRNINDLKALDELARRVGADRILVSNVLPYSAEMEKEMLCLLTLTTETLTFDPGKVEMSLPRIDVSPFTREAIYHLLQSRGNLTLMGNRIFAPSRRCRFVEERTTFVRWDGKVSPCMGLLHDHATYLYGAERRIRGFALGDLASSTLGAIWTSRAYRRFRERVRAFDFSPCHVCGGCQLLEGNDEDCYGNAHPACGGCLWAQGIIQCP
jgi:MoaA/NifB/PqqE/SkfB family radical SAM enzyme